MRPNFIQCTITLLALVMAGPSFAAEPVSTLPYKQAILKLLEGTYGEACAKTLGTDTKPSGSPISINANGMVNWGTGSVDVTKGKTSEFSLLVSHVSSAVGFKGDLKNPTTGDRTYIVGLTVSTDGTQVSTSASDETHTPSTGDLCASKTAPAAKGAKLWPIASQFMTFSDVQMKCFDTKTNKMDKVKVSFSAAQLSVGTTVLPATAAQESEMLSVGDDDPFIGLAYTITNTKGDIITVQVNADHTPDSINIMHSDMSSLRCTP